MDELARLYEILCEAEMLIGHQLKVCEVVTLEEIIFEECAIGLYLLIDVVLHPLEKGSKQGEEGLSYLSH